MIKTVVITHRFDLQGNLTPLTRQWLSDQHVKEEDYLCWVIGSFNSPNAKQTWDSIFSVQFMDLFNDPEMDVDTKDILHQIRDDIYRVVSVWRLKCAALVKYSQHFTLDVVTTNTYTQLFDFSV